MRREHRHSADSQLEFETPNYGVKTTSEVGLYTLHFIFCTVDAVLVLYILHSNRSVTTTS